MPPRVPSPFKPGRPALIEPIMQPLYSSNTLTVATPEATLSFVPVPAASQGDFVRTNIQGNQLANPKIFVVEGHRVHISQDIVIPDTSGDGLEEVIEISEQYSFRFFVGTKDYLRVPLFWMSSGIGTWTAPAAADAEATNEFLYVTALGVPHRENYFKIKRRPITIPPQQEFLAEIIRSQNATGAITGVNLRIWWFAEGSLGREVMGLIPPLAAGIIAGVMTFGAKIASLASSAMSMMA
ncbi:MAG: hypothetical protein ACREDF_08495 [Thermoplasmata archaeon]